MAGILNGLFAGLIFVTVALTAFSVGLVVTAAAVKTSLRRVTFYAVILVNVVVVPLLGYVTLNVLHLTPGTTTGVMLCAICAGGPLGLKASQIARADVSWSLTLTVMLLLLNVVTLPLWSAMLLDESVTMRPGDLVGVLVPAIVAPVLVGMWVNRRVGAVERLFRGATIGSNVGLVLAIVVGVAGSADGLVSALSSWVFVAVLAIVIGAALVGAVLPDALERRRASTLGTLNRATSVALLAIARGFDADPEILTAAVIFGLIQTVAAFVVALYWGMARARSVTSPVIR